MTLIQKLTTFVAAFALVAAMVMTLSAPVAHAALTETQIQAILSLLSSFGADSATIDNVNASLRGQVPTGGSSGSSGSASCSQFTRDLTLGSTGSDVQALQVVLNSHGAQVASSGAGSPGNESSYFGALSQAALAKWQAANGVSPAAGYFGPLTRAALSSKGACGGTSGGSTGTTGGSTSGGSTGTPSGGPSSLSIIALDKGSFAAVPNNISAMSFGKFSFTAGTSDVVIKGLTIGRSGAGDKDDFDDVWITADGVKHGSERSIVAGDRATFSFLGDDIVIPSGKTVIVSIMGSFDNPGAGKYNLLSIVAIDTTSSLNTSLPLEGRTTTTSTQNATVVTFTPQGADQTITVGDKQTEIGRFKLDVDSDNDNDVRIMSITLENEGVVSNLPDVIANTGLRVGGEIVTSSVEFVQSNDALVLLFGDDGYLMEDGASQSFTIVADIMEAEPSDTIKLELDEDSDIEAIEVGSDFGIRVQDSGGNLASNEVLKIYSIDTGDINLSIEDATSRSIAPGLDDITFVNGRLVIDSAVRIDGAKVRFNSSTSVVGSTEAQVEADIENVELRIDNLLIDTVDSITEGTGGTPAGLDTGSTGDFYNFNSTFIIEAGIHTLTVEADVKSGAATGDKIKLQVFSADFDSPEYVSTGDDATSELTGNALGSLITIQDAQLTLNRNDGFAGETLIGGVSEKILLGFTLTANDSSDIEVTSLTIVQDTADDITGAANYDSDDVTNMRLFIDGKQVGSPIDLTNGNFTDIFFIVPQSQQVQAQIVADTNTITGANQELDIKITDATAFDEEGNSADVVNSDGTVISATVSIKSDSFAVSTGGTFTLTIDGDTPDEAIVVGSGTPTWIPIATYRLTAEDEDIKLTDLFLENATSAADVTATTTFTDGRITTLGLFDSKGVLKGQKTLAAGKVRFDLGENINPNGFGAVVVPADNFTKITIKAKVSDIIDADKTGRLLRFVVAQDGLSTGNTGVIVQSTSVGDDIGSSSIKAARDGATNTSRATSTVSDFFALRRTQPTLNPVAQSSSDTILNDGSNKVVYRFTITADQHEDIAWKGIKFDVEGRFGGVDLATTTSDTGAFQGDNAPGTVAGFVATTSPNNTGIGSANVNKFELFETGNNQEVQDGAYTVDIDWDSVDDVGEVAFIINSGTEEVVSAGTSKTYEVRATVSGASTDGDFIDVAIDSEADDASTDAYLVQGQDPDNVDGTDDGSIDMTVNSPATSPYVFLWSDNSGSPHQLTTEIVNDDERDWTNDRFIDINNQSWSRVGSFN